MYMKNHKPEKIRIACIGDSITEGALATNWLQKGYVGLFSELMGDKYEIGNFGFSGATACRNTYMPYEKLDKFTDAKEFLPQIVTIKLGTNDCMPLVWNTGQYAANFKNDLIWLCRQFEILVSHPHVYLCLPIPIIGSIWGHQPDVLQKEIIPVIKEIACEKGYKTIDLHTPLIGRTDCYPAGDMLHPNNRGHLVIAAELYRFFTEINKTNYSDTLQ